MKNKQNEIMKVHVYDVPHQVRNFHYFNSNLTTTISLSLKQIRNRTINHRYRHEVICHVYP
jgi:hypothetical protein